MDDGEHASGKVVNGEENVSSHSLNPQKQEIVGVVSNFGEKKGNAGDATGALFYMLLLIWLLSIIWKLWEGKTNLWPVVGGFIAFEAANRSLSSLIAKPTILPALQAKHVDNFINTAVSLLHSTSMAFAVTALLLRERYKTGIDEMWTHEVLTGNAWAGASAILGASCGYFAYDQWDMLQRRLYRRQSPSLLIHHAVLLTCFTFALYKSSCINYLIFTLGCEVHSIFLHLRKVSILAGAKRLWSFSIRVEWILSWLAYFTTRITLHILITVKLLQDRSKFGRGVELPLALIGMAGLNVLNFILGQGMYKAYIRECTGKLHTSKEAED